MLFIHLNSMSTDAAQEAWLRNVAAAADADSTVDWVVSLLHHPYQAEQYVGDISQKFRDSWMAILAASKKHVLNIGGHHHLYARGQTRDWPIYHMISGGTAWDQYWSQSREEDFDDVQKTIANWAWQIVDIDVAARTMKVETYAEAHPIVYVTEGFNYHSKLIDSFTRKLDGSAPGKPSVTSAGGTIDVAVHVQQQRLRDRVGRDAEQYPVPDREGRLVPEPRGRQDPRLREPLWRYGRAAL